MTLLLNNVSFIGLFCGDCTAEKYISSARVSVFFSGLVLSVCVSPSLSLSLSLSPFLSDYLSLLLAVSLSLPLSCVITLSP